MNIVMMTNTFTPHVGGVARSISAFIAEYRKRGHRVLTIAPEFENQPEQETDVVRIPAIQNFNGSDFSVVLPLSGSIRSAVEAFQPHIVHSHHPFLVGSTALRVAHMYQLPLVFTHHTMYEQYTHYVPGDSKALKRFVINLSTSYANLCDHVFAPSDTVLQVLRERGVTSPISVVPTGVNLAAFGRGSGSGFRAALEIPNDAFVVGHVGRLAQEKNIAFLANAVAAFLKTVPGGRFLVVGAGPADATIRDIFERKHLLDRLLLPGVLTRELLVSAYRAMDVFAFASKSETQGMVLTEAMAAGVPVVAIDASGVREVVQDTRNGRLLHEETVAAFAAALQWVAGRAAAERANLCEHALATADSFSLDRTAETALGIYEELRSRNFVSREEAYNAWSGALRLIKTEWDLLRGLAEARTTTESAEHAG